MPMRQWFSGILRIVIIRRYKRVIIDGDDYIDISVSSS